MTRNDAWAAGDLYEPYVGRWSRPVALTFLDWLAVPAGSDWVDFGCGTGAVTQTILATNAPRSVVGIDRSEAFVAYARDHVTDEAATFRVADITDLDDASADAVVSGLVLNFVADPSATLREMLRVVRPGGTVAAYVWDYADKMQLMRVFWDAAVALDPSAEALDEGTRFEMCAPEPLERLFTGAGLRSVDVRSIDVSTRFTDFDDYWTPFLGGQGPAPGYAMSLSTTQRDLLRDEVERRLPIAGDGSIDLVARAWAVRGRR
jgi:trans-aconitate methyltransferase